MDPEKILSPATKLLRENKNIVNLLFLLLIIGQLFPFELFMEKRVVIETYNYLRNQLKQPFVMGLVTLLTYIVYFTNDKIMFTLLLFLIHQLSNNHPSIDQPLSDAITPSPKRPTPAAAPKQPPTPSAAPKQPLAPAAAPKRPPTPAATPKRPPTPGVTASGVPPTRAVGAPKGPPTPAAAPKRPPTPGVTASGVPPTRAVGAPKGPPTPAAAPKRPPTPGVTASGVPPTPPVR